MKTFGRIAGCVAAYAFVLNVLLIALSGALNVSNTLGKSWQELCLPSANGSPADNAPAHAGTLHCLACTAGSQLASLAPDPSRSTSILTVPLASFTVAAVAVTDDAAPASFSWLSPSPRGPPALS